MRRSVRPSRLRPHHKTSTGCWTCRRRRIKCDEQKPGCMRCVRYGVQCSGYGGLASSPAATAAAPPPPPPPEPSQPGTHDPEPRQQPHSSPQQTGPSSSPPQSHPSHCSHPGTSSAISHRLATHSNDHIHHDDHVHHDWAGHHVPPPHASPQTHLDLLRLPSAQKRLVHHWVTYTSTKLVLVDEPHNPCRTLMLPMALRGLMSTAHASTADIAIFHAVCACAAYNLYNLATSSTPSLVQPRGQATTTTTTAAAAQEYHALALAHDQQAISHLRHDLSTADTHHDQSSAMAIMACITIEAISGSSGGRWRTHVIGGLAYLRRLRVRGGVAVKEDVFATFQAHLVSMAILCGVGGDGRDRETIEDDLKGFLHETSQPPAVGQDLELRFPYYGASRGFLRRLDRLNTLAATTTNSTASCTQLSSSAEAELDALELQLYLDFPSSMVASSSSTTAAAGLSPTHAIMLHHMAQAFYYASLVFCQRCVRRQSIMSVQTLVESGVKQLEAIEAVSGGSAGSVMMWPALVLGAECMRTDLRTRVRTWFDGKMRLGFANVRLLRSVIEAVWSARDAVGYGGEEAASGEGSCQLSWQELIREPRFDVFRL